MEGVLDLSDHISVEYNLFRCAKVNNIAKPLVPKPLGPTPTKSQYVQRPKGAGADTKMLYANHHSL